MYKYLICVFLYFASILPIHANVVAPFALDEILYLKAEKNHQGKWFAHIRTPNNVVHKLTIGQVIGNNHGKIIHITPTDMTVEETITRPDGSRYTRKVILKVFKK